VAFGYGFLERDGIPLHIFRLSISNHINLTGVSIVHQATIKDRNLIPLYSLFIANAISLIGNVFTMIAIPWFVLQTTGSAAQTGVTGFFTILPVVLAGFFGGTLIDRLGYKRTSIISDLASGITTALIPILYLTVGLEFWHLMLLVFLGALLDAPGGTARHALLLELCEQARMPIERATSLAHVIERSARLVGAPLAGLLIGIIGTANVLWLDAASFFISAGIVWILIPKIMLHEEKESRHYLNELMDGLRFIRQDQLIFSMVMVLMLTNFLDAYFGGVLQPVYVREVYGNALYLGLLLSANGGGAVIGGLIFAAIGHRMPRHATFVGAFVFTGLRLGICHVPARVDPDPGHTHHKSRGGAYKSYYRRHPIRADPAQSARTCVRRDHGRRGNGHAIGTIIRGRADGKSWNVHHDDRTGKHPADHHNQHGIYPNHEGDEPKTSGQQFVVNFQ